MVAAAKSLLAVGTQQYYRNRLLDGATRFSIECSRPMRGRKLLCTASFVERYGQVLPHWKAGAEGASLDNNPLRRETFASRELNGPTSPEPFLNFS